MLPGQPPSHLTIFTTKDYYKHTILFVAARIGYGLTHDAPFSCQGLSQQHSVQYLAAPVGGAVNSQETGRVRYFAGWALSLVYFPVPPFCVFRYDILVTPTRTKATYDAPGVFGFDFIGYYLLSSSLIILIVQWSQSSVSFWVFILFLRSRYSNVQTSSFLGRSLYCKLVKF